MHAENNLKKSVLLTSSNTDFLIGILIIDFSVNVLT